MFCVARRAVVFKMCRTHLNVIVLSFQAVWVFSLIDYEPPTYHNGDYVYPWWAEAIGWSIASLSLICIPAFAVYVFVRADGVTFAEVR